jgi:PAS domain S-box-containing protein
MKKTLLKNVPIQRLLLIIYAALLIGLIAVRVTEYKNLQKIRNNTSELLTESIGRLSILTKMRRGSDYTHVNVLRLLLYTDKEAKEGAEKTLYAEVKKNDNNMARYEKFITDRQEQQLFDTLKSYRVNNTKKRATLIQLIKEGKNNEAVKFNLNFLTNSFEDFQKANTTLSEYVNKRDTLNIQNSEHHFAAIEKTNTWFNVLILLLLIPLSFMISKTIRKLKASNLQLAESERKYRSLLENTNEIINKTDNKGRFVFVNNCCKEKLEYSEEELSRLTVPDILSEESKHLYKPNPGKSEFGEIITSIQKTLKSKSGKKIIVEGNIVLDYKNEIFAGATAFFNDVTEKIHMKEALIASEEKYRQLFNLSPVPMWIYDPETFKFIQVNSAAINNYGYSEKEFLSMTIMDIRPEEDILKVKEVSRKNNGDVNIFKGSFRHIKNSGKKIDVEIFSTPVFLNGERLRLVTAMDVTERNLYEKKVTKAIIKTQEDERYQIGCELHDNVCQLLATSQLTLGMLKNSLQPETKEFFDQTREYITLATEEIRNLSHRLAPAFLDESTLVDAFEHLLVSFNIDRKYEILLNFDGPSKRSPFSRDMQLNLYRILQEQMKNILKYANATRIEVEVIINNNILKMRIADNGVGFDTDESKGGIGLANMTRRSELFSGNFAIHSTVGNGCEILVEIPLSNTN